MKKVLSAREMSVSDKYTCDNITPSKELMFKAGKAIFELGAWRSPVAIVCGGGNNAGDGYVVAYLMKKAGIDCSIVTLTDKKTPDGAYYFDMCQEISVDVRSLAETDISHYASILDCIFGIGFRGEVGGIEKNAIELINSAHAEGAYVVCADINSGLSSDSGLGNTVVMSDLTVSVGQYKSGHFLGRAKDVIGNLVCADVGIEPIGEYYRLVETEDLFDIICERANFSNKGTYGYVALLGGCENYSGAMKLASCAYAAMRSGAGVAKLIVPREISNSVSHYLLENTLATLPSVNGRFVFDPDALEGELEGIRSLAVGMGMGRSEDNERIIRYLLLKEDMSLIIDADGLNTVASSEDLMEILKKRNAPTLLTPHPKEFERLSGISMNEILSDPIYHAKEFAKRYSLVLLLKGSSTVITDGNDVYIINRGCAGMATAGSGDVLSGVLAGISGYTDGFLKVAVSGAYIAGLAGEYAQRETNSISMTAGDTVRNIPKAISEILEKKQNKQK
ncbi:MAG: NAD(P)H-hydrate dehydratase [Clostridia bacterium]|nr:NAD(P)H-hydrate dehydratase [Clostridia bacterium]